MKGVFLPGNKQVMVSEVETPSPGVGQVLVRVKASAICRSDMSLYYGGAPTVGGGKAGGCVSGHEPAGLVEEIGAGVTAVKPGDRVAVHLAVGCGHCEYCQQGISHLCAEWDCLGFTVHGGNAEFLVVPERNCLPIPDGLSYVAAAVSTDAFGTLFSACKKLNVSGATTVGIWGMGPMGASGVMVAKARGGRVIAVDPLPERRAFALELGADLALDPTSGDIAQQIRAHTHGRGLDVAIDCSGNPAAENAALDSVSKLGKVAFIGESHETTIKPSEQLIRKQITVMGSWYFSLQEYAEITRMIIDHDLDLERLVTHTFSLDDAATAFQLFDERKTEKAVFVM
jgi:L-iditol 2-dehydrogenase